MSKATENIAKLAQVAVDGSNLTPSGTVGYFPAATPPTGWLKANGDLVSRTTYAALFAVIGTTYGAGDSSTTFALPDLRGEFIRSLDDGRGVDAGRGIGTAQGFGTADHTHNAKVNNDPADTGLLQANTFGNVTGGTNLNMGQTSTTANGFRPLLTLMDGGSPSTETRPRNVALLACIKT